MGMIKNETQMTNTEEQRQKIRKRYKGISPDLLDIIPANPKLNFFGDARKKRVAVYARVSTGDPHQTSSYELQRNHYTDAVSQHEGWELKEIYADEGISGTSLQHRDAFIRMITDCMAGKIDLIVTKSVSRFSRNVLDCIGYVRKLAALDPPVEIYFETEGIHTLSKDSEMQLAFLATLAQEESHNKSEIMNASYGMRFSRGLFLTPELLGYNHDEDGNLVINPEEALTVKFIFYMCLLGYSCTKIAEELTTLGRKTKRGNTKWNPTSIRQILQNERHCGDVLAQKTWTPNYLDHKSKKNHRDRNQYLHRNHHEPIISREDFMAAQKMLRNAKYGHTGFLPEMQVITEGSLKGYVSINPTWAGFKATDYIKAVAEMIPDYENKPSTVIASSGEFDLRGYEIAHSQFFSSSNRICTTFSDNIITFSTFAIQKLSSTQVELLVNPREMILAIRPAIETTKNCMTWAKKYNEKYIPRQIRGKAFLPTLYELFGWKKGRKYRIQGVKHQNNDGAILIFDVSEAETFLPNNEKNEPDVSNLIQFDENKKPIGTGCSIIGFPADWAESFGTPFYKQQYSHESTSFHESKEWDLANNGQTFITDMTRNVTPPETLAAHIQTILGTMNQEETIEYNHTRKQYDN